MDRHEREEIVREMKRKYGEGAEPPVRETIGLYEDVLSEYEDVIREVQQGHERELHELERLIEASNRKTEKVVETGSSANILFGLGLGVIGAVLVLTYFLIDPMWIVGLGVGSIFMSFVLFYEMEQKAKW